MVHWDDKLFATFTQLRDEMRAATKAKNYPDVIALGKKIVALEKCAEFLGIATQIFLRDMGKASLAMGDNEAAERYFVEARRLYIQRRSRSGDWEKDIATLDKRLEKLRQAKAKVTLVLLSQVEKVVRDGPFPDTWEAAESIDA